MANPFITLFKTLFEKNNEISDAEIKKATQSGEIVANNVAQRLGIFEQVSIDADAARIAAKIKEEKKIEAEKEIE